MINFKVFVLTVVASKLVVVSNPIPAIICNNLCALLN